MSNQFQVLYDKIEDLEVKVKEMKKMILFINNKIRIEIIPHVEQLY